VRAEEAAVGVGFDLINAARALFAAPMLHGMSVLHNVCVRQRVNDESLFRQPATALIQQVDTLADTCFLC
jgi:hypothetical protein